MLENVLYFGDNLNILQDHIANESVDLIYLDPPFNSNATYNVLFQEQNGSKAAAQLKAFEDSWEWNAVSARTYDDTVGKGGRVADVLRGFETFIPRSNMLAYLSMMAPRLVELRRVLKATGSIYLHSDPTASHYLKILMDAAFGARMFRNEVVWVRDPAGKGAKRISGQWPRNFDVLLFYSKTEENHFEQQYTALTEAQKRAYRYRDERGFYKAVQRGDYTDESMARFRSENRVHTSKVGKEYVKYYLDAARSTVGAVWSDIYGFGTLTASKERLGYPTQKPEALLERIILASSNEGDIVLDPFCGCGTTVVVAQRLGRHWLGIDITQAAITVVKQRLAGAFGKRIAFETRGEPETLPDARALAALSRYDFQWWALALVGARPVEKRRGGDEGIDGVLPFHDGPPGSGWKRVLLQVKSGSVGAVDMRDLRGTMERDKYDMAALLTLEEPTRGMVKDAASGGFYDSPTWHKKYPRVQILTIADLFAGKGIDMPPLEEVGRTFREAPKAKRRRKHEEPLLRPLPRREKKEE